MSKLSIYLAGPITGLSQDDKYSWREKFEKRWGEKYEVRNPLDRDHKYVDMNEDQRFSSIANDERIDILNCDVTIAYIDKVSMGTAMGIMYAYLSGRTVVIVTSIPEEKLSPMVKYHAHGLFGNFEDAVDCIEKRHSRCSISSIIKRDGQIVEWDPNRIHDAIKAAIDEVYADGLDETEFPRPRPDKLAQAVVMQIEDDLEEGLLSRAHLTVEKVQDKIEKILIDNAHRGEVRNLAKAYIIFRRIRQEAREARHDQDEIMEFIAKNILHSIKAPHGNLGRYIEFVKSALDNEDIDEAKKMLNDLEINHADMEQRLINSKNEAEQQFVKISQNLYGFFQGASGNYQNQNVIFHNHIPEDIFVEASPNKLKTVFQNLINNSIIHGFKGKGGNITVKAKKSDHNNFILEYWNDGDPITKENAESIFSGVRNGSSDSANFHHGMSQVRRYIEEIGGSIECRPNNRVPHGQSGNPEPVVLGVPVFRIKLPLGDKNRKKCILVADDSGEDRKMMRRILEKDGHDILEAGSIDEALHIIQKKNLYGAVLDVDFNESRDGLYLLKEINKKNKGIKTIVVSGSASHSNGDWRSMAEDLGALQTFDKAFYKPDQIRRVF
jgi:signal transduction histidine kinase/CheY-like chemotaxis protein/nucleoside 2-deoxyribosyltransferase